MTPSTVSYIPNRTTSSGSAGGCTDWAQKMDYPDYEFLDTLAASRKHFGCSLPNHQLQTVAAACGFDLRNHHNALADAEACAYIAMNIL